MYYVVFIFERINKIFCRCENNANMKKKKRAKIRKTIKSHQLQEDWMRYSEKGINLIKNKVEIKC